MVLKKQFTQTAVLNVTMDVDIDMSSLEIRDNDKKRSHSEASCSHDTKVIDLGLSEDPNQPRRSGRKRIRPVDNTVKRRVMTRPRKLHIDSSMKDVANYYLDKKVKLTSPALETIFEEPKQDMVMSARKFRRCINFSELLNGQDKTKTKKRSMKAKKINGVKKIRKKIGMELLMEKLKELESCREQDK